MYKRAPTLFAVCVAVTAVAFVGTPQRAAADSTHQLCHVSPAASDRIAGSYSSDSVYGNGGTFWNLGCTLTAVGLYIGSNVVALAEGCTFWENQYTVSYPCALGHSARTWTTQQGSLDGGRSWVSNQYNC